MKHRVGTTRLGLLAGFFLAVGQLAAPSEAQARKPEDIFKGQVIITKKRLPSRFGSSAAFVAAISSAETLDRKDEKASYCIAFVPIVIYIVPIILF